MTRKTTKLSAISLILALSALLGGCEVPAPGTPIPTVTRLPATSAPATATLVAPAAKEPSPAAVTAVAVQPSPSPQVAIPTALQPATSPTTAAQPSGTPVTVAQTWPSRPTSFAAYPETILAFLNSGPASIVRLRPMLWDWKTVTERMGGMQEADLDGDGQPEWVVALVDPTPLTLNVSGNLLVLDRQGDQYRLLYQIAPGEESLRENVMILATQDLNADGIADLVYTTDNCGAHTCFKTVHLYGWDGKGLRSLSQEPIQMPYGEVALKKRGDGAAMDVVLTGGAIGSVGAGPQRTRTEVYSWSGTHYVHSQTTSGASDFLYFYVLDANEALSARDYAKAIALYQQVVNNKTLRAWNEGQQERDNLTAFARYRLVVTYALAQDEAQARETLATLQREQPSHIYTQVAQLFWKTYEGQKDFPAACAAVTNFAASHPQTVEVLQDYGYANPTFTPEMVCPIGSIGTR